MKFPDCSRKVTLFIIASALCFGALHCSGQEMTMAERRQSVVNLEQHIAQRKQRLESIAGDIRTIDARVENGIEKIVNMVSTIGDSGESKLRVAQLKGDIVSKLRKSIEIYKTHRDKIKEQLRREVTAIPRDTLQSDLKIFNDRIEKRVKQIEEIAASFPEPKDLEKYVVTDTYYWGWATYQNEEISEAWKQERRESKQTKSMQKQLLDGLEESINHLKTRNDYLTGKLNGTNISSTERNLYQSEIEGNLALMEIRRNQITSFTEKAPAEVSKLSRGDAHDTELLIRDMVDDLRDDFFSIFQKYSEMNKERADLESLQVNLVARKKWLAENDKGKQ